MDKFMLYSYVLGTVDKVFGDENHITFNHDEFRYGIYKADLINYCSEKLMKRQQANKKKRETNSDCRKRVVSAYLPVFAAILSEYPEGLTAFELTTKVKEKFPDYVHFDDGSKERYFLTSGSIPSLMSEYKEYFDFAYNNDKHRIYKLKKKDE